MKEQTAAVQRMQDYIEEHLEADITLTELSAVSLFSPWHSYRLFKELLGVTPAEYIRRLRLSRSAMRLKEKQCLVTEAAFDCGFNSVDGYTRAFYREFGCRPGEYMKDPVPIPLFMEMKNLQSIFIQVIRKPERGVIIKRGIKAEDYFEYCDEVSCEVWGKLKSMDSLCGEPVCLWLPEIYKKPGTSTYVQGVEVEADYEGNIPEGFDIIVLPAAEYLAFQGEPFREEDYSQAILAVQYAIDHYDPSVIGYEWDKDNPRIQLEPRGERGYIELRAIRKQQA